MLSEPVDTDFKKNMERTGNAAPAKLRMIVTAAKAVAASARYVSMTKLNSPWNTKTRPNPTRKPESMGAQKETDR